MTMEKIILKHLAKKYYKEYYNALDDFSCGSNLAEHLSSRVSEPKRKFNKIMDELVKIDPSTPKVRL